MIQVQSLVKRYKGTTALNHVTFTVKPGEIYGLLGPNGSGKTTTLRILASLISHDAGDVQILGQMPSKVRDKTGVLFDYPRLYPYLTGQEHLLMFGDPPNLTTLHHIIEQMGLAKAIRWRVSKYSLGMQQRLLMAGLLLRSPQVYILDEPTTGLDQSGVRLLQTILREEVQKGKTILITSHSLADIAPIIDRVGILARGTLVFEQTVKSDNQTGHLLRIAFHEPDMQRAHAFFKLRSDVKMIRAGHNEILIHLHEITDSDLLRELYEEKLTPYEFGRQRMNIQEIYAQYVEGQHESVSKRIF